MKEKASERKAEALNPCHKYSWEVLEHHAHIYCLIAKAVIEKLSGNRELMEKYRDEAREYSFLKEEVLQPVLDSFIFKRTVGSRFRMTE